MVPTATAALTAATTATLIATAPAAKPPAVPPAATTVVPATAALPPPPAAAAAAPPVAPALPAPNLASPSFSRIVFFSSRIGPSGKIAASARLLARSCVRKLRQRSHSLTCRRTGAASDAIPSAAAPSSRRTSSQVSLRASAASARPIRARTSSDLTLGTVVSITSAICSYDSASISRSTSAERWVSGRCPMSSTSRRNSSRLWTFSLVDCPASAKCASIESTPIAVLRRRWFSERLRAMR